MAVPVTASSYSCNLKLEVKLFDEAEDPETALSFLEAELDSDGASDLSDTLLELIMLSFQELLEGPWEVEIDEEKLKKTVERAFRLDDEELDSWLAGHGGEMTGTQDLLALVRENVAVGNMEDGTYVMHYKPTVTDGADAVITDAYTFVLTKETTEGTFGGGDDDSDDSGSTGGNGNLPSIGGGGGGGLKPSVGGGSSGGGSSSGGGASIPPLPPVSTVDTSSAESWAVNWITRADSLSLLSARNSVQFTKDVTRVQFADLAVTLAEQLTGKIILPVEDTSFTDTTDVMILKAKAAGIAGGYKNDATGTYEFRPNNPITREEICVMLAHVVEYVTAQTGAIPGWDASETIKGSFPDLNKVESWAVKQVALMANNDIMSGRATATGALLTPKANTALQEAITLAVKLFDKNG